ncbi:MAG: sensor histidine kinase [Myxococcota bacterium]
MPETLFAELKRYVGFTEKDEAVLRSLHPVVSPHFQHIADVFYRRILEHEQARTALTEGESQVGRLKVTLTRWMDELFTGPWGEAYFAKRAVIGRVHVRIGLPQHYMFGAMNVVRNELDGVLDQHYGARHGELLTARSALDKLLDLELAIMLHTYREDLLAQQARIERLSTFGQLVGSIGHELRNPLGVIETSLFILKGRVSSDERATKHLERIGDQVKIAGDIISQLLDMIRDRPLERSTVFLPTVLAQAAESVSRPDGVSLQMAGLEGLSAVDGDEGQLRQVFVNLFENAVQACGSSGEVRVEGRQGDRQVSLTVSDTGPGVAASIRARLFEPLVTTKQKGIGLGLALVKRIIERHGGTIAYRSGQGGGACFDICLPSSG